MSSGVPYIGSKISLITTSDMRYEGFLRTLNREESTIAVESVRSFGTEGRADQTRGQSEIPVSNEIYDFIVFRGKDLKDLTVLQGIPENAPQPQPAPATRPPAQSPHMQGSYGQHLNKKNIEYDTGPGMYHPSQMAPSGPMGEGPSGGFGSSGYQRHSPPAVSRNGYGPPPSSCGGAGVGHMGDSLGGSYLSSTGSRPPSEKSGYAQVRIEAPSRTPPSYHDGPHGPPPSYVERPAPSQYEDLPAGPPRGGPGCGHRMGDEGKGGPAAPRPPGAMTSHVQEGKDRNGHQPYGMPGAVEGKGASAGFNPSVEAKGRGRGKGGQKQTLSEVLKTHKKAEEAIVKLMRSQGSAAVSPQELRAMSEQQGCIYHFHLDYLNFCGPASGGAVFSQQSDEQNWDSLAKALKKHFEKDFGSGPSQQKSQPQRPNNTLADFITVDTKQNSKKNAKVQPTAAKAVRGGAGRGGRGAGAKAKEVESTAVEDDDPSAGLQWTCPRCTLKNDNHLQECLACGTSKSVASLWAEFPPLGT
mmetsp:Transcript_29790/g.70886  ORF Transcript_29790/g.70886 Transcript_29790/m.70886 type:complete len:526 (-) Transcript_29790:186-1763(-)|eukprot:CAMPEP_0181463950 /NCGR_PEP_ID=MMETSP1110-20121109/35179_1 /TAXON_ID=174948 /ORGANISM="Symbiodinium sp., Strain CCMP421" /LENGTH=525 /DNA_ID=CAMNT_0023588665 /DNA_START=77 /DNA_END=1654 /DNA_ORIENTATION=-